MKDKQYDETHIIFWHINNLLPGVHRTLPTKYFKMQLQSTNSLYKQARQNWGAGGAMVPPLFCQAKLHVELDFKISTELLNFEIIHSIY